MTPSSLPAVGIPNNVTLFPHTPLSQPEALTTLFRDNVWKLHSLPETTLLDRGPQFVADFMKELNDILGIKTKLSIAYHPQTDGQTERLNQEIKQYLWIFVNHQQNDWPEWIACTEFAYNNKVHTATHVFPFYTNYGYNSRMGIKSRRVMKLEPARAFAE